MRAADCTIAIVPSAPPADSPLQKLLHHPRFPQKFGPILTDFVAAYRAAAVSGGTDPARAAQLIDVFLQQLDAQLSQPFVFEPYHRQVRTPFDSYRFGLEFVRPLVDKAASSLRGRRELDRIAAQLATGDNVIFLANHQTEGDPQAIALLLEETHPDLGRDLIFVAGERVTSDPLAVPFSMGCNLLCIYSKRHIDHPPDQRAAKQQHNARTMERMSELLAEGGRCVYAAPSGGRDRANAQGVVEIAPFDPNSVEMYYLMARRARRPSHFYPMALDTYAFLPPPGSVQVELGEPRIIRRCGIHLAIGPEVDMDAFPGRDLADKHARRAARAQHFWQLVAAEHARLGHPAA
jgi:glycerol-3-phosphate O-acyltransferase